MKRGPAQSAGPFLLPSSPTEVTEDRMHEPIGTYRCEISIFAQGCVTVSIRGRGDEQRLDEHVHCGPFPDHEAISRCVAECYALWAAGEATETISTRLSAL